MLSIMLWCIVFFFCAFYGQKLYCGSTSMTEYKHEHHKNSFFLMNSILKPPSPSLQPPVTLRPTQPTVTCARPSWRSNKASSRPLSQAGSWVGTTITGPPTLWRELWLSLSFKPSLLTLQPYCLTASWSKLPLDQTPSRSRGSSRNPKLDQYERAIFNKAPYCPNFIHSLSRCFIFKRLSPALANVNLNCTKLLHPVKCIRWYPYKSVSRVLFCTFVCSGFY